MNFSELKTKLSEFDITPLPTALIIVAVISAWAFFSLPELEFEDCYDYGVLEHGLCGDHAIREYKLATWEYDFFLHFRHATVLSILAMTRDTLGDPQYVTFFSSGALLVVTFFFGRTITKSNVGGLVSLGFLVVNPIFFRYDTGITYPTFWTTFYILSCLAIFHRSWVASPLAWVGSVATKIMGVLYFPVSILFIWFADIPKRRKQWLITGYCAIAGVFIAVFIAFLPFNDAQFQVDLVDFAYWLGMWSIELSNSRITLVMLMVCFFGLFLLRKEKVPNATAILAVLIVAILQPSIISGFTTFTNEEYRFLPLVVFIGAGLGLIVTNLDKIKLKFAKRTVS